MRTASGTPHSTVWLVEDLKAMMRAVYAANQERALFNNIAQGGTPCGEAYDAGFAAALLTMATALNVNINDVIPIQGKSDFRY